MWHFNEPPEPMGLADVRREAETRAILNVLHRTSGDKERAAKILCVSPRTLRHKIQTYKIKTDDTEEIGIEPTAGLVA
jgi:DNA-binding NtrC family response regulator